MATPSQFGGSEHCIKKRREFFNLICGTAPTAPRVDLPMICDAWRSVTNADWVWFWLFNDLTKQWQLLSASPQNDPLIVPQALSVNTTNSVNEYIHNTCQPILVPNLKDWQANHGNSTYKVAFSDLLLKMGCAAFQAVPLLPPIFRGKDLAFSQTTTLRMSICAHYRDANKRTPHDDESLLLIGRAAAQAVMNSYLMEQRTTLLELNLLAAPYLTKKNDRPLLQRKTYTKEIIDLVCEKLSVKYASIFYHTYGSLTLECLGSTGLFCSSDKKALPPEKISGAVYRAKEGVTWRVFENGKPYTSLINQPCDHIAPKYTELPFDIDESTQSWIIYPISEPYVGNIQHSNTLGVIRCIGTCAHLSGKPPCNLDQMQILLLDCISRQIGFVLETLSASVSREKTISTVRHDLLAPVQMIRDTVELMLPDPMPFQEDIPTNLKDLLFSSVTAFHLIPLLDPNPAEIAECDPAPVMLSGDIVARLKAMLTPFARRQSDMKISFGDFSKIPSVKVDRVLLERVLYNLIMNAVKYGAKGSEIKIVPTLTREGVIIGVMNDGEGILEDEKDEIFEGSYRSPRFEKKLGLGLGLKIARAAMRKQDGDVVLSQLSNPTIFSIIIPKKLIV